MPESFLSNAVSILKLVARLDRTDVVAFAHVCSRVLVLLLLLF